MAKTFGEDQIIKIERPHVEPVYFVHIYLSGETLYFSDRNFKFNGHDYEAYLLNIPETIHSIERFGGYLNLDASLTFRNERFRTYEKLIDFFIANPLAKREMDIFVIYIEKGEFPGTDVSTKLHRVSLGEFSRIQKQTFDSEIFSILHSLDSKKIFTQINRTNFLGAAPSAIGKYENLIYGSILDIPCPCIWAGAVSTLFMDVGEDAKELYLSDVDNPIAFPSSGTVQVGIETIMYTGKDSTNNKLTGCTRGVSRKSHVRGEPVFQILSGYKYLVAGHVMKSISKVKVSGVRVSTGDYTVNLNDGGRATISFTSRNLLRNQGAHSHSSKEEFVFRPTGSSFTYDSGMAAQGVAGNLIDCNETTLCSVGVTGTLGAAKNAYFQATFPTWDGQWPDAVYACVVCEWSLGSSAGEYFRISAPDYFSIGIPGGVSGGVYQARIKLEPADKCTGGTATVSGGSSGAYAFDDNEETYWQSNQGAGSWIKYDRGAGRGTVVQKLRFKTKRDANNGGVGAFTFQGSNDDSNYVTLVTGTHGNNENWEEWDFTNETAYRYFRLYVNTVYSVNIASIYEMEVRNVNVSSIPSTLTLWAHTDAGDPVQLIVGVYEMWLELEFQNVPSGGEHAVWEKLAPLVTCDGEGFKDDGSGTYTGTPNALIQNPSDVRRHLLVAILGRSMSEIGSSFGTMRTTYANRISGGYKFGLILSVLGTEIVDIFEKLDQQSRSQIREDGGKFELSFNGTSEPTSVMTIDKTIYIGDPVFDQTRAKEIRNLIRARYDRDWGGLEEGRKFGDYKKQIERLSGSGDYVEDIEFPAIQVQAMAEDVADWILLQKKGVIPEVNLECNRMVRRLERGDHFVLNDCPVTSWEGSKWRVLRIREIPNEQKFLITAIKFISS